MENPDDFYLRGARKNSKGRLINLWLSQALFLGTIHLVCCSIFYSVSYVWCVKPSKELRVSWAFTQIIQWSITVGRRCPHQFPLFVFKRFASSRADFSSSICIPTSWAGQLIEAVGFSVWSPNARQVLESREVSGSRALSEVTSLSSVPWFACQVLFK